jgi:hypothetical protein
MTPLEQDIQNNIAKVTPDLKQIWTIRLLAGGAVYFLLGGRNVRMVAAGGAVYYLVEKKYIKTEIAKAENKVIETFEQMKKRMFGGK